MEDINQVKDVKNSKFEDRHEEFQLGTNPAKMTAFEKRMVDEEREERYKHKRDYILGLQGRDGGCNPDYLK